MGQEGTAGGRISDERSAEPLVHLQRAALELIEAARAWLDVAEEAVSEPGGVAAIVAETLAGLAGAVGARPQAEPERPPEERRPGVEHIRLS